MSSEFMFLSKLRCFGFFPPDSFSFIYKLEAKLQGLPASNQELEMKVRCYISLKTTVTTSRVVLSPPKVWLKFCKLICCSIPVMSDSSQPHGLKHTKLPCLSPTLTDCTNSHPLSRWCHPHHLILCHPLLLLPSIFCSIRVFSKESVLHIRWPKYRSFSFSISPSNEYSGLISFRIDWFDILAIQGTLKSLLQYHSSKASILRC